MYKRSWLKLIQKKYSSFQVWRAVSEKITTFCAQNIFLMQHQLFFCRHEILFLAKSTRFCRNQNTFCAASNSLFQHKIIFRAAPNFCFGHRVCHGDIFLLSHSNKNIITCQKINTFIFMWHKKINFVFSASSFFYIQLLNYTLSACWSS